MTRRQKNKLLVFVGLVLLAATAVSSTSAHGVTISTSFFGDIEDNGEGCGVYMILNIVLYVITAGVGVIAMGSLIFAGVTYILARDDESQVANAKRRIRNIVIGLFLYATFFALVNFVLLGGGWNATKTCAPGTKKSSTSSSISTKKKSSKKNVSSKSTSSSGSSSSSSKKSTNQVEGATAVGQKMLEAADLVARTYADKKFIYFQYDCSNGYCNPYMKSGYGPYEGETLTWNKALKLRYAHCSSFVTVVEKKAGLLPDSASYHSYIYNGKFGFKRSTWNELKKNFTLIHGNGQSLASLVKSGKLAPGDAFGFTGRTHTMIYAGKSKGKYWIYEVTGGNNARLTYEKGYTAIHKTVSGSKKVGDILHAK